MSGSTGQSAERGADGAVAKGSAAKRSATKRSAAKQSAARAGVITGAALHAAGQAVERDCDVCIIGSGAGGAVLAAGLAARGVDVVMLEEGGYFTRSDFKLEEAHAYPTLYQEQGGRATADLSISILQGRSVGGSTTVNWTTCFRTPGRILEIWRSRFGLGALTDDALAPHFEAVEQRLNIHRWPEELVNANNGVLLRGGRKLGWDVETTRRNVKGCANSGYCGMGCPVDGKQAMGVTYIEDALNNGMTLYADVRAERIVMAGDRATAVEATALHRETGCASPVKLRIRPKVVVSSAGAINGPALLLRSGLDPNGLVGYRTYLHPVIGVMGIYDEEIRGFYGAPQSATSHRFIERGADKVGFFLEAAPVHPMLSATAFTGFGAQMQGFMRRLSHVSALLALHADGVLPGDHGGRVSLRRDGRVRVDYPIGPQLAEAFRASHEALGRVHLAAGALQALTLHGEPVSIRSDADLAALDQRAYGAHEHSIFTAHQMGGLPMGANKADSVVDPEHRVRGTRNLFVVDGSVLPTSLGVNPSLTIYGLAHRATAFVTAAVG